MRHISPVLTRLDALMSEALELGCRIEPIAGTRHIFYGEDCLDGVLCGNTDELDEELENYRDRYISWAERIQRYKDIYQEVVNERDAN